MWTNFFTKVIIPISGEMILKDIQWAFGDDGIPQASLRIRDLAAINCTERKDVSL